MRSSPPEEPVKGDKGLTIDNAIEKYLVDVRATKSERTFKAYRQELLWFRKHSKKRYVSQLDRSDAMMMFAKGREERKNSQPLNQKTINKRVIMRGRSAEWFDPFPPFSAQKAG